jgi:hypothetical protein
MKFFLNRLVPTPGKSRPTWINYNKDGNLAILAEELPDSTLDLLYQRLADPKNM